MKNGKLSKAGAVFVVNALVATCAQAADINLGGIGYIQYGDALVYSMPVANYQFGFNTNNGPYAIDSTPGAIKDLTVIATGAEGKPVTENTNGFDNAYSTPTGTGGLPYFYANSTTDRGSNGTIAHNGVNTWDASLSALKTTLGKDQMVFFFNNNQVNSGASSNQNLAIWARAWITDNNGNPYGIAYELTNNSNNTTSGNKYALTTEGGGGTFFGNPNTYTATAGPGNPTNVSALNADFVMAGGEYCVATGGSLTIPVPVKCGSNPAAVGGTAISAPISHNLGADHVAYSVVLPELNGVLATLFGNVSDADLSQYTMHLDVRMGCYDQRLTVTAPGVSPWMSSNPVDNNGNGTCLNNGYEQIFMGTANLDKPQIPEPASLALIATGLTLAGLIGRRRKSPLEREAS